MSARYKGGPAFPVSTADEYDGHQDGHRSWQFPGMSLRDYFAAKALAGIAATVDVNGTVLWREIAADAYAAADAMLAERAK